MMTNPAIKPAPRRQLSAAEVRRLDRAAAYFGRRDNQAGYGYDPDADRRDIAIAIGRPTEH